MDLRQPQNNANDVNRSYASADATSFGRDGYGPEVAPVRYQETVCNKEKIRIGAWNVNTFYLPGKYDYLRQEMKRMKLDILGVSEVRWTGGGWCMGEGVKFFYGGGKEHHRGVGVMMTSRMAKCLKGYMLLSDRVILTKFAGKPIDINIIQVYTPTARRPYRK